ncbi:hypothetical protein DFH07DRAFT_968992 [Mycena maculata]|uniref:Uncharacterized protein n=1 Tax=Mycena maculata TaxID=230809 RepID=A0AAD7HY92_9AGAR|nr:hypothetical protein DFH07DRAFT_968992 [Mycena maculata]
MARHLSIRRLDLQRQFKDALDAVTKIQREIREKRAWLEIVDGWISCPPPPSPFPRSAVIIPADDSRLGVWINSTTEKDTYWFLTQAAVPCFMIQELGVDQKPADVCHSFVERTEVEGLLDPTKNPEDAIAHGGPHSFSTYECYPVPHSTVSRSAANRNCALLSHQQGLPISRDLPQDVPRVTAS